MASCQNTLGRVFCQQHAVVYGEFVQEEDTLILLKDMRVSAKQEQPACGMFNNNLFFQTIKIYWMKLIVSLI